MIKLTTKIFTLCAMATIIAITAPLHAEDVELPSATEVQYYSPEGQQFYSAGIAALDSADYTNAYNLLSKAAALQPNSVNLNRIAAKIAMYQGRQHPALEARDYYETAISALSNILRLPTIHSDLKRQVTNELKVAQMERDNLAQRDVIREATGTALVLDWNSRYATLPSRTAGVPPAPNTLTSATQVLVDPNSLLKSVYTQPGNNGQPGFGGQPGFEGQPGFQPGYNPQGGGPGPGIPPPVI